MINKHLNNFFFFLQEKIKQRNVGYICNTALLTLLIVAGYGKNNSPTSFPYRIQHITTDMGLPQNTVDDILKDSRGFMWFATWNGLCRFDGYSFEVFRSQTPNTGIPNNFVRCLAEDNEGLLWIGTADGIAVFDLNTETFLPTTKSIIELRHLPINVIYIDGDYCWIGSETKGLFVIQKKDKNTSTLIQKFDVEKSAISHNQVNVIYPLNKKELIIGTHQGVKIIDREKHEFVADASLSNKLQNSSILSVFNENNQFIWVGTWDGLFRFGIDLSYKETYQHKAENSQSLPHNKVNAIVRDNEGRLLFGTLGGLCAYNRSENRFERIGKGQDQSTKLNNEFINSMLCDEFGNVWIGTEKGGVNQYNIYQKSFKALSHNPTMPNTLSNPTVNSIYANKQALWIGTAGGGINEFNLRTGELQTHLNESPTPNAPGGKFISSIMHDDKNNLWLGTWGNGLYRMNNLNAKTTDHFYSSNTEGFSNNFVSSTLMDQRGFLLVGTEGGLFMFDKSFKKAHQVRTDQSEIPLREIGCI